MVEPGRTRVGEFTLDVLRDSLLETSKDYGFATVHSVGVSVSTSVDASVMN